MYSMQKKLSCLIIIGNLDSFFSTPSDDSDKIILLVCLVYMSKLVGNKIKISNFIKLVICSYCIEKK